MKLFDAQKYAKKSVFVALSGGVDSVCLLHAFREQAEACGISLHAIHVEHGIRGEESLRDMAFCKEFCALWEIPLEIVRADVSELVRERGGSVEEVAREVRYGAFYALLGEGKADVVATAHHADDVAETVLFRLARGTGLFGMRAITEHDGIIRPLLGCSRSEIEAYAAEYGLPHTVDSTNADERYTRNYIRHTVLPAFEGIHGNAARHLVEFASLAAEEDDFLENMAESKIRTLAGEERVPADLPDVLFRRACLICLRRHGREASRAALGEISSLRTLQSGRKVTLPCAAFEGPLFAVREGDEIVFTVPQETGEIPERPFEPGEGSYPAPTSFSVREIGEKEACRFQKGGDLFVDLDAFPKGCVVRNRRVGDVITPYHAPKRTLKKFFTDRKIPARIARKIPVIARENVVYAVVGVEISDDVKITDKTVRRGVISAE